MYIGVFDLKDRLQQMKKILHDKRQLHSLLEEEIQELEEDIRNLKKML